MYEETIINIDKNLEYDLYTGEKINLDKYRSNLKKTKGIYNLELINEHYKNVYSKELNKVIYEFFELPTCPVSGKERKLNLYFSNKKGKIKLGPFGNKLSHSERNKWLARNDPKFISFYKRISEERKGSGNPMYGKDVWNKGLTKETNEVIKKISEIRKGKSFNEIFNEEKAKEIRKKFSVARQKNIASGNVGGMKGKTHSKETREKLRKATLRRLKENKFPQTDTGISRKIENELINLNVLYEKEFLYGHFSFDFKVENYLIEVNGDYWHWNQNNPKFKDKKINSRKIINNVQRDKAKRKEVLSKNEYKLMEIWEYDIENNFEKIQLCLKELFHKSL